MIPKNDPARVKFFTKIRTGAPELSIRMKDFYELIKFHTILLTVPLRGFAILPGLTGSLAVELKIYQVKTANNHTYLLASQQFSLLYPS